MVSPYFTMPMPMPIKSKTSNFNHLVIHNHHHLVIFIILGCDSIDDLLVRFTNNLMVCSGFVVHNEFNIEYYIQIFCNILHLKEMLVFGGTRNNYFSFQVKAGDVQIQAGELWIVRWLLYWCTITTVLALQNLLYLLTLVAIVSYC